MNTEINKFHRINVNNRWKQRKIQRSDNWLIFGMQTWWASPYDYCYKIGLFGIDIQIWFKRTFI